MKRRKENTRARIVADLQAMARDTKNTTERRIIEREIRRLETIERQKEIRQQFHRVR